MKAGSLQRMTISVLCESPRDRHLQEKCASKCVRGIVLSAFIYFLAQMDLRLEIIWNLEFEISDLIMHVWLSSKSTLLRNRASNDFVGASPTTCTRLLPIANWRLPIY